MLDPAEAGKNIGAFLFQRALEEMKNIIISRRPMMVRCLDKDILGEDPISNQIGDRVGNIAKELVSLQVRHLIWMQLRKIWHPLYSQIRGAG